MAELKASVEALLFTCAEPTPASRLAEAIGGTTADTVKGAIAELKSDYAAGGRAFDVVEVNGGFQLLTKPEFAPIVGKLHAPRADRKLSPAALDALAIVAYKQPITRAEIEAIRGVASGELLRALLDRGLIRIAGRAQAPGSPLLYGTSPEFLELTGLKDIKELPKPEELK